MGNSANNVRVDTAWYDTGHYTHTEASTCADYKKADPPPKHTHKQPSSIQTHPRVLTTHPQNCTQGHTHTKKELHISQAHTSDTRTLMDKNVLNKEMQH